MTTATAMTTGTHDAATDVELATFYVADVWMGIDILHVQEVLRDLDVTVVPHARECVRGVVNLRGDVVTVIDVRTVLGLGRSEITEHSRNVILAFGEERVGLLVDRTGDVIQTQQSKLEPPPPNVGVAEGRVLSSVLTLETDLLAIVNVEELLATGEDQQ